MSYPQPRPAFPDASFPQASAPQQHNTWQPQQPQANNDFNFYSPAQPQQHQQHQQQQHQAGYPQQTSPPQPMYGDAWQADNGARHRPAVPGHMHSGSADGNGQVAFMPQGAAAMINNPMAGMALDMGKASFAKNLSWVMSFLSALKYYFHVNNRYVVAKLRVLLLPLLHSNWQRVRADGSGGGGAGGGLGSASPMLRSDSNGMSDDSSMLSTLAGGSSIYKAAREDVNAPDLYIPTMAFVTLVLAMGYALGTAGQFHPEILGLSASRALVLLFFEVLALKFGLYLIAVPSSVSPPPASLLDLVAYAAYKYVHCILMIAIGLLGGSLAFYVSILLLGATAALFMMRTMKRVCSPMSGPGIGEQVGAGSGGSSFGQGKHRRNYFLLVVGGVQILFCWLLVRSANAGF